MSIEEDGSIVGPAVDVSLIVVLDCMSSISVLDDMPSIELLEDIPAMLEDEVASAVVVVGLFMPPGLEVIIDELDLVSPPMLPILDEEVEVIVVIGVAVTMSFGEMRSPPT